MPHSLTGVFQDGSRQVLWEDGERIFCRAWRLGDHGNQSAMLVVLPAAEHPSPSNLDRFEHEYGLKDQLDGAWAVRPLELVRDGGRTMLVLEDPGGVPLDPLHGVAMEVGSFLRLAVSIVSALGKVHQRGLVHKDIKPAHILVNRTTGEVKLTGFGIASRLSRERRSPEPPETIAGTLAYMAPEQTGRMNRSIDSRSDLYSLGVTLYQMFTGSLPFTATDPMEWVHCHIARKPVPPSERLENVPAPVSAIIMRLLVKTPEDRYQTAAGLERDLQRCLAQWEAERRIDDFPLGEHDMPDRLLIPERLYGRSREVETLVTAFDRMVTGGTPELVLVSGYSGIGKSSVVNELHKVLVPPRGLFASGKFDQYKRDIPYATLAQAFQSLVRYLLGKSDAELSGWRDALGDALGPNGPLMIDLVPELKLIIGDQPQVPELSPQDALRRFQVVFRRFIGVFAQREHPLALFLDDLQWLDAATLDLLEVLLTPPGVPHLLLIGAYRDNEVTAAHPLTRKLEAIRNAGANVHEIALAPLACEDVRQLVADALHCNLTRATPLAQLVHGKTAGNPFFLVQFLQTLAEEGWLAFNHERAQWYWDLDRIHAKRYRDNVVDLMVGKLNRLPLDTRMALQQLACLGNIAPVRTLSLILEKSAEDVGADLWEAVRLELVEHLEGSYKFVHDRVQEAAYSLIPEAQRDEVHLRIGRRLAAQTPPERREEAIFDIVNQFNRSAALIDSPEEREQVAELNLMAGKRAKAAAAYASALKYLEAGAALQPGDSWERQHAMSFELELHRAECEFLTGALAVSEERLKQLAARAANTVERARVASLRVNVYTTLDQSERAVEVCLEYLAHLGVEWPPHPAPEQAFGEYQRIWSRFGARSVEELIDLPLMSDPAILATLDVLTDVVPPALFTDRNLLSLVICRMVNLSLEYGNSDASCFAYVFFGMIAGPHFDNYAGGFQFGRLGYELTEKRGLQRYQARTYMAFGNFVMPWTRHVRTGRDLVRRAFDIANKAGDLTFAAYSCNNLNTNLLAAGDSLAGAQREAERGLEFAQKARFGLVIEIITAQLQLIRTLRGLTPTFGLFDCEQQFNERRFEDHLASQRNLALPECWYWIRKLQARVLAGDYRSAIDAASKAQPLLWTSPSFFETAEYEFYGGLARAGFCNSAPSEEQPQHQTALCVHHKRLEIWATHCPENFESRAALVGAEIARIDSRVVDAEQLYEQAIRSAHEHGFVQNEGLAYELAAQFYAARGFDDIAHLYLRRARHCYARWGADGKVRQLDERHPHLREEEPAHDSRTTIGEPVERLELATVLKVSQAVSGEIVLEKLVDTVLRTAIEYAGAERGLLILLRGTGPRIAAEATTGKTIIVHLRDEPMTAASLPQSVIHYVLRVRESVILDDAMAQPSFAADPYINRHQSRSILCLPLLNQGRLLGVLYLENNLLPRVFAPAPVAVLKLLAAQAATSLENTRLYRDLAEREAKIRRLVEANIIGIFIWDFDGRILEANEAFLDIVGYDHEDLVAGRIRWTDLTPPEWRDRDTRLIQEHKVTGTLQPFEKEYSRKDGSRVPVLMGVATFEESGNQGVAFVLDLTERKLAEQALRRNEAELIEAKRELQQTIDIIPMQVARYSSDFRRDFVNAAWKQFTGVTDEAARDTKWLTTVHPDDLAIAEKGWSDAALANGEPAHVELRLRRADGQYRWFVVYRVALRDENGKVTKWYSTGHDIEERKRAEDALRESEAKFRDYAETASDWFWEIGPDYKFTLLTENAFDSDSVGRIGTACWDHALDLETEPEKWRAVQATLDAHRPFRDFVYRSVRGDGTPMYVKASGKPVFDASGEFRGYRGTGSDVTAIMRSQEALRESERRSRSVIDGIAGLVAITAPNGELETANRQVFEYFGRSLEWLKNWQRNDAMHPEDLPRVLEFFKRAMASGIAFNHEVRLRRFDGEYRWFDNRGVPIRDDSGRITRWYVLLTDIEDRTRALAQLEQMQSNFAHMNRVSMMGELAASLSHEITQPIASARNNARAAQNFLNMQPPDLGEVREALSCVVGDTDRAGDIVDRIRDHIKKAPPRQDQFDLNAAINEVLVLARNTITKNGVLVWTRLADGLFPVRGDRVQLQQVVLNLILNAVEAMGSRETEARELLISSEQDHTGVLVAVRDSGPGIDPDHLERVFQAFYTTKLSGTGMGLSICRSIIDAHGGRLWAEANEPRGAVFQFTLPGVNADRSS
jgi:PAS domain S-box-containing protein